MFKKAIFILIFFGAMTALALSRALTVFAIAPNVFLLFFALLIFIATGRSLFFGILATTLLSAFILVPFWFISFMIMTVLALVVFLFKKQLTGNALFDFLIIIASGTILFYIVSRIQTLSLIQPITIIIELVYNIVLGSMLWFVCSRSGFLETAQR